MNARQRRKQKRKELVVLSIDQATATITIGPRHQLEKKK